MSQAVFIVMKGGAFCQNSLPSFLKNNFTNNFITFDNFLITDLAWLKFSMGMPFARVFF